MSRRIALVALLASVFAVAPSRSPLPRRIARVIEFPTAPQDWPQFNYDASHSGSNATETAITPANVATLQLLFQAKLSAVSDGSAVYWSAGSDRRRDHYLFFTTTNGGLVALSGEGALRWHTTPPAGPRWTTSSPALDPSRRFVYSYGLDGRVHKYAVASGDEVADGRWPVPVTLKPEVEKASAALSIATDATGETFLYATIAGYPEPGDEGDYQGHVVAIRLADGRSTVFNALCSYCRTLLRYGECKSLRAGIWGRPGVVYNAVNDSVYVVTSNGSFTGNKGGTNWGDSIVRLPADLQLQKGRPIDSYTPAEFDQLDQLDLDLGSSAIALIPRPGERRVSLAVHAGKDGVIRVIDIDDMSGTGKAGAVGGELQRLNLPQGGLNFSTPAVWTDDEAHTWVYFTNNHGIAAFEVVDVDGQPQLVEKWHGGVASNSSPVAVNGLLFCARNNRISAYDARTGRELWSDTRLGQIHWQSPIVVNGAIFITDLDGVATAWALPKSLLLPGR